MHSSLFKKFFERMDKALENGQISLSLLYGLNDNEYETSLTVENYIFYGYCLDYAITRIISKLDNEINEYQIFQKHIENAIQLREQIIYFLKNLCNKLDKIEEFPEKIIDSEKLNEYVNKNLNSSENENIDLDVIRKNLTKLITKPIDWTKSKKCNLITLLFLGQDDI